MCTGKERTTHVHTCSYAHTHTACAHTHCRAPLRPRWPLATSPLGKQVQVPAGPVTLCRRQHRPCSFASRHNPNLKAPVLPALRAAPATRWHGKSAAGPRSLRQRVPSSGMFGGICLWWEVSPFPLRTRPWVRRDHTTLPWRKGSLPNGPP